MSEIDDLMDQDPLGLSSRDLDKIIAYHRQNRAKEGEAPKGKAKGAVTINVQDLLKSMVKKAPEAVPAKPSHGGIRRI